MQSRIHVLSFRPEMRKPAHPPRKFWANLPPEPNIIVRFLVLNAQKKEKNRGSKKLQSV